MDYVRGVCIKYRKDVLAASAGPAAAESQSYCSRIGARWERFEPSEA